MKIGIIGHFGGNKKSFDGQTIKTMELKNYLEKYFKTKLDLFDTYHISKNIFKIIIKIKALLKNNEVVIVSVANRGYQVITPIIILLNKFYQRKLIEVVIGGTRYNLLSKHSILSKLAKKYNLILVETNKMKEAYLLQGFRNVLVMPNFKSLVKGKYHKTMEPIKLCTFSRIIKEKGIDDSIKAVIKANSDLGSDIFSLDIYGEVAKKYEEKFNTLLLNAPKYIKYKGKVNYQKSSIVLNDYDILLFLTYYENEGFAATFLDAFNAGIPVITTKWNSNEEIIKEGYNGLLVNIKNPGEVASKLIMLYNNKELINVMKKNCLHEANNYQIDQVLKILVDNIKK